MPRQIGGAGYALLDVNNVEYLKKAVGLLRWLGFPVRQPAPVSYGGGGYGQYGRLILDGDGGGSGSSDEDERYEAGLGEGFGGAHVGFALINGAWLRVYPLVGVGGGGQGFSAFSASSNDLAVHFGSYGAHVLFGLGVELRLPLTHRVRPLIGFRLGLRYRVLKHDFSDDGTELPPQKRAEPFFRPLIGLGIQR